MSSRRKIMIVFVALLCAIPILGAIVVYKFFSPFFINREIPAELKQARIIVGTDFLTKSEFYPSNKKGTWRESLKPEELANRFESINEMTAGDFDGQPGRDIGLVGRMGVTLLDERGNVKETIKYQFGKGRINVGPVEVDRVKTSFNEFHLIDIEGDGVCEILAYGGLEGMSLFNHQGQLILSRGEWAKNRPSIKEVVSGDVDGDGNLDFLANWGYAPSAAELFDRQGNTIWRIEEEFGWGQVEILDLTGDKIPELLEDGGSSLKIRDNQGKVIDTVKMPVYLWHLSLCARPDGNGLPQNLAVREGSTWLIDLDGKNYSKWKAPLSEIKLKTPQVLSGVSEPIVIESEKVYRARGAWVKFKDEQTKYLAVIASFGAIDRSLLYVYDAQGKLMYHEILPETCSSVVVVSADGNSGKEEILINGESTVWRYAAKVQGP